MNSVSKRSVPKGCQKAQLKVIWYKELFAHNSGQTWLINSRRCRRMFKYSSAFIMVFWSRNFLWVRPFLSKNATCIVFICDFDIRAFFGLASPSLTNWILWCLVSGSYLKSHDLLQVITGLKMFSDSIASSQSQQTSTRCFFCSSGKICRNKFGTRIPQTQFVLHN